MSLKVAFMGTPEFSRPVLSEILNHGHEVVGVWTRPPAAVSSRSCGGVSSSSLGSGRKRPN